MKIESITATPFRIPFAKSIALSTGRREAAEHLLVEVRTDDGINGWAECVPRPTLYGETVTSARVVIQEHIAPRLAGSEVNAIEGLRERMGLVGNPSAQSSVEIAAFDALAKSLGLPAHVLLGGYASRIACAPLLGYGDPASVVTEAEEAIKTYGARTVKFKIGPALEKDVAVARALRDGLGDAVELYADANAQYSFAEATRFLRQTEDCRLRFLEELLRPGDLLGKKRLAQVATVPLVADESCPSPADVAREVLDGRATGVSIKPARSGITGSTAIRTFAGTLGLTVVVGSQGDSAIGAYVSAAFAASAPATAREAAEIMFFLGLEDDLVAERPVIRDGSLELADRPGFGFDIDEEKLAHYSANGGRDE
jgi:L-alanine-DL-glutamate epimerase-like enolase superfamily enzyme